MSKSIPKALVWFRRGLHDYDHTALYHALKSSNQVYYAFVFDTEILDLLTDEADRRVEFIWESARALKSNSKQSNIRNSYRGTRHSHRSDFRCRLQLQ